MPGLRDGLYPGLYRGCRLAKRGAARRLSVYPGAQPMVDAFTAYNY